jgi:protein-disulfide isomerase
MFSTLHTALFPRLKPSPIGHKVQFIFRPQVQPWHPSSTLTHEAGVAVARLAPVRFWDFAAALFAHQKEYFDVSVVDEPRNATYRRLARLAHESAGVDEEAVYGLLAVPTKAAEDGSLNVGNGVTDDLKLAIRMARLVGVHVSPTVIFDGVEAREISSSWTADQWIEWLTQKVGGSV